MNSKIYLQKVELFTRIHHQQFYTIFICFVAVNTRTYCARSYIIQARETYVSSTELELKRALEDKRHLWSKDMRKYGDMFKRIEKKLDKVHDQNQQIQKKIKKINDKPNQHAENIQLLLYLEEKKRK